MKTKTKSAHVKPNIDSLSSIVIDGFRQITLNYNNEVNPNSSSKNTKESEPMQKINKYHSQLHLSGLTYNINLSGEGIDVEFIDGVGTIVYKGIFQVKDGKVTGSQQNCKKGAYNPTSMYFEYVNSYANSICKN